MNFLLFISLMFTINSGAYGEYDIHEKQPEGIDLLTLQSLNFHLRFIKSRKGIRFYK